MTDLYTRATREGTPVIDGDRATFVWRGARAPRLIGDFTHWQSRPLALRRTGPNLWSRAIEFYDDAYVEYAYLDGDARLRDPLNPRRSSSGIGDKNQFFFMPRAGPTPLARRRRDVPRGHITSHEIQAPLFVARGARKLQLYTPSVAGPWPLLVVFD